MGLGRAALLYNLRWFVTVRWVIASILGVWAAIDTCLPDVLTSLGFAGPNTWLWALVVSVSLSNIVFWLLARRLSDESPRRMVARNLWAQIVVDLIAVTLLVHFVGSTETYIPSIYLLHVVCSCIFFSPKRSFLVTLIAAALYVTCISLEYHGVLQKRSILLPPSDHLSYSWMPLLFAASAVAVWFAVWYLAKSLSRAVIERDRKLEEANKRLLMADEEKNKIVLRTTHDLKAPFSGIESNIQILKLQCGDELSERANEIIDKIEQRSRSLAVRIRDILLLGGIRSENAPAADMETLDVSQVISEVKAELEDKAKARDIQINMKLSSLETLGHPRHYSILFANLIANAITYSRKGGTVTVEMSNTDTQCHVIIKDKGIGIAEDALPHIFDEYYRTSDAATHNARSTGLGLAIVQEIALKESLEIRVTSEKGRGTQFDVVIPRDYSSV